MFNQPENLSLLTNHSSCPHASVNFLQVALSVAIDGFNDDSPPQKHNKYAGDSLNNQGSTGKAASLEMEELNRTYAQCGHLSTAAGHTLKKNPDLHLHNSGAWLCPSPL